MNTADGKKARYVRRVPSGIYNFIHEQDADISLFARITNLSRSTFDALHTISESELKQKLDMQSKHATVSIRLSIKQKLSTQEMHFVVVVRYTRGHQRGQPRFRAPCSKVRYDCWYRLELFPPHFCCFGCIERCIVFPLTSFAGRMNWNRNLWKGFLSGSSSASSSWTGTKINCGGPNIARRRRGRMMDTKRRTASPF